jgi:hypothetical protein
MLFEYDSSPIRNAVIGAVVVAVISLFLPDTLFRLLGLSFAVGPAAWALIQWRLRGHGVRLTDNMLLIEYPLTGRTRKIPYVDIPGSTSSDDNGLIVAYLSRPVQPESGDYPAISPIALSQTHSGIRRHIVSSPRLKDVESCLAALAQYQQPTPPGLAEKFSDKALRALARGKSRRRVLLFLLLVLTTPIYVIIIMRLFPAIH